MATDNIAIRVLNLNLEYRVYQYRSTTLKEFVMNRLRGKGGFRLIKALADISFSVRRGESVALIGHNGCGKSTLLKCLAGIYRPSGAQIEVNGRTAPMIELGAGFDGELSGLENIRLSCMLMGLSAAEVEERIDSIVEFSELQNFIHIPFKNYSSGMQARLGFACTTAVDPDVLLIDEVLAVGDSNFAKKCLERILQLKERGTTIVFVSHDLAALKAFCERGLVIDEGCLIFDGPINEAVKHQEEIMDRRYLASLSNEMRSEVLRLRELRENSLKETRGEQGPLPKARIGFQVVQNGQPTLSVDVCRPFEFRFRLKLEDAHLCNGDLSVGFGLNSLAGVRVGGHNNLAEGVQIPLKNLIEGEAVEVKFPFLRGLEFLAPGSYKIVCGVHDQGIRRTIFFAELSNLTVLNERVGVNLDGDILVLSEAVNGVEIDWKDSL